jgi:hypothetical protein
MRYYGMLFYFFFATLPGTGVLPPCVLLYLCRALNQATLIMYLCILFSNGAGANNGHVRVGINFIHIPLQLGTLYQYSPAPASLIIMLSFAPRLCTFAHPVLLPKPILAKIYGNGGCLGRQRTPHFRNAVHNGHIVV